MEPITVTISGNNLILSAHGRIDSSNAGECESIAIAAAEENKGLKTVLDAEDLLYISSAGLRVILKLRKADSDLKLINVSPEVYEILEMTGFSEMITVEKAYRRISVEGCEVIGRGANGEVYRLDPDTIIKVYLNPDSLPDIQKERELARKAFILGIPTAIPYDVVKVGEGYGSVFELLNTQSIAGILAKEPDRFDEMADMYAALLKLIHSTEVKPGDMPDMKATVLGWVDFLKDSLPEGKWQKLHDMVEAVPESHHMLHGDYHIKNVLIQNGEALLIDMDTLAQGNPVFEFASIYNAYEGFMLGGGRDTMSFLGISEETAKKLWNRTLRIYFGTDDETVLQSVKDKAALIGCVRLLRRTIRRSGAGCSACEIYRNIILELIDKVDSITL